MKRGGPIARHAPLKAGASRPACKMDDCDRPRKSRGLCGTHYQRWQRHGDATRVDRPGLREEARFAKSTRRGEPSSYRPDLGPCLIYTGADNGNGYGQFAYNGKNGYAHRYAWERVHGPIPDDLTVDHLCRVRCCVEVTHMELVTAVANYLRGVAAWTMCRSGKHERTPENTYLHGRRRLCAECRKDRHREAGARRRNPPGTPDPRVRYDQDVVRAEIARVRSGDQSIAVAARAIGCNPNYLGRRIWREARKDALLRDEHRCLVCGQDGALDVHHRRARGSGGTSNPLISFGLANLMSLCRACHHSITTNPLIAQGQGWSVPSHADPLRTPVWLARHGWVLLNDNGTFENEEAA